MGKNILINLLILIATNGYWYCATQQETMMETPIIVLPIVCTLGLMVLFIGYLLDNWDE